MAQERKTERHNAVAKMRGEGKTIQEMADLLGLSLHQVEHSIQVGIRDGTIERMRGGRKKVVKPVAITSHSGGDYWKNQQLDVSEKRWAEAMRRAAR